MPTEQNTTMPRLKSGKFFLALALVVLALAGLILAQQFPASYTLDISDPAVSPRLNRFHNLEKSSQTQTSFRWAYPQSQFHLLPLDSSLRICLDIENPLPPERTLSLGLPGKPPLQTFPLEKGQKTYCIDTGRAAGFFPHAFSLYKDDFLADIWLGVPLEITTQNYSPPGDRRELGLILHRVTVQSAAAAGRWGLPSLLEILITLAITLGAWGLLSSLGWRWQFVAGGTLLLVAGWLVLVAGWRVQLANKIEFFLFWTLATLVVLFLVRYSAQTALSDLRNGIVAVKNGTNRAWVKLAAPNISAARFLSSLLIAVAASVLILQVVGGFFFGEEAWGFSRFAPPPRGIPVVLTLLLLTVGLLSLNWKPRQPVFSKIFGWSKSVTGKIRLNFYAKLALLGLLTAGLLYFLRIERSYGDSNEIISKLKLFLQYRLETGQDNFLIWREREPLDFALHFLLWRAMLGFEWWQPEYSYIFPAVLAGGLFVIVTCLLASLIAHQRLERYLIGGLIVSSATGLVFFGYIESYTLVTLVALVYVWLATLAILKRASSLWAALALIIAVLLHPQAVFLGISFLLVLLGRAGLFEQKLNWQKLGQEIALSVLVAAGVSAAFGLLAIMYNYSWASWGIAQKQFGGSDNGAFKPLLASSLRPNSREVYPVLSLDYLLYQLNLQMRIAPLALPLLATLGCWKLVVSRGIKSGWLVVIAGLFLFFLGLVWNGAQAVIWLVGLGVVVQGSGLWLLRRAKPDLTSLLLGSAAIYTWLFSLAWNPDLGANDWDLLSLNGIFTSLWAGYLVTRMAICDKRLVYVLLSVAIILQIAWVTLHHL